MPKALRGSVQKGREIAKQAPAVQSAEAKLKSATTPEERHQAGKEFHEAMRNAILTADPTLADLLDKKHSSRPTCRNNHRPAAAFFLTQPAGAGALPGTSALPRHFLRRSRLDSCSGTRNEFRRRLAWPRELQSKFQMPRFSSWAGSFDFPARQFRAPTPRNAAASAPPSVQNP